MIGDYLLDTNVVIRLLAHDRSVEDKVASGVRILLSTIVIGELYYGAFKSKHVEDNLVKLEEFAGSVELVPWDMGTAREFGRIKNELQNQGRPIPVNDIWLAAIARQHDLCVVSADRHFNYVKELKLELW